MKKIISISHSLPPDKSGQALKGACAQGKVPFRGFRGKKIILILVGFCFLFSEAFGQIEIEWQKTIGGNKDDFLTSIEQTLDGGYIIGGYSESDSSGDKTEGSIGASVNYDYWVLKLDSSGNIQWQNTIGGTDDDELSIVSQTSDGGYILGGSSYSNISSDKSENNVGLDYWVVKLDAVGNIQWDNTIIGNHYDRLKSLKQTADGGYFLGGYSISDSAYDKTENNINYNDYWVLKLDSAGAIQWQKTIGGNNYDELNSVQLTSDGGYILGGVSYPAGSYSNYLVIKLDSSGNIQWQHAFGGGDQDYLNSLQQTTDGGYILGGYSGSDISGNKTENCLGYYDYWVIKLNSMGNIQWQNTIGGTGWDVLSSVIKTTDGGYLLKGSSSSMNSFDKIENCLGGNDIWIVKLDSTGNIQNQKTIGGYRNDDYNANYLNSSNSITKTTNGGYIFGTSSSSNISGDKSENCKGNNYYSPDYWIVKFKDKYNSITGKLFIDANSNQTQDAGEPSVINNLITESNTGRLAVSQQNGIYYLSVLDSGNFSVSAAPISYYSPVPASYAINFSGINQTDSLNDFAFQSAGVFNDLCVTITPMGNFRAGFDANYMIDYENVGTSTLNGTVIFFPDNDVTFVSSNPTATSITTDSVIWNVGTLAPFQTGSILVTVHVNAGTPNGTLINSSVEIDPVSGDANTACNYNAYEVFVTGAVDPNAILVDRDTILTTELSSPPYLNYIIYFQNTGNDTAFNARVLNNIPQKLDVNSFEFVASSHPMNIMYGGHSRLMEFTFDNILLPDSNVNEPASHGFIRYRIKPLSTLVAGDSIKNNAAIYFDFNYPVLTDTAVTEIVLPTGVSSQWSMVSGQLAVYPNPAGEELIVKSDLLKGKKAELKVYDLYGREVFQLQTANCKLQTQINVSHFSQGIYFVQLQSGERVLRGKFLKE